MDNPIDSPKPPPEATHPYSVRMALLLGSNLNLLLDDDELSITFARDYVLRFVAARTPPREEANRQRRLGIHLDAFSSAAEAERAGKLLTLSVLWFAAYKAVTIGFRRRTGDYPFAVRDRTVPPGITMQAEGYASYQLAPEELAAIAEQAFIAGVDPPQNLLISMEFFAAARLESTDRARFISLMTALEASSTQQDYGEPIVTVLDQLARDLQAHPMLIGIDSDRVRSSLAGRVRQLRHESVRQAILRTVRTSIDSEEEARFVDDAYGIRSKMLHEGHLSHGLHAKSNRLEGILRQMYSAQLGLSLPT